MQIWHASKVACLNISNLVNTKVAEFITCLPHGGQTHLLSVKNVKIEKQKGPPLTKVF